MKAVLTFGGAMPSWNIHIAHAERLFEANGPVSRIVRDRNAFLFGNLIPDIYVGYMVPGVVRPIPYRITHFANPEHIPKPRFDEFWERFVDPAAAAANGVGPDTAVRRSALGDGGVSAGAFAGGEHPYGEPLSIAAQVKHVSPAHAALFVDEIDPQDRAAIQDAAFEGLGAGASTAELDGSLFDMLLGTWVHLLADCIWNQRVSDVLFERGETPSSGFRVKKQADFDLFGKSLSIDLVPHATPQLIAAAAAFPQYPLDERSVYFTEAVAHETVRTNFLRTEPEYQLLDATFFARTFDEVNGTADRLLGERLVTLA